MTQITDIPSSSTSALLGMSQTSCTTDCCPQAPSRDDNDCDSFSRDEVNPASHKKRKSPCHKPWDKFFQLIKRFLEMIMKMLRGCKRPDNDKRDCASPEADT